MRPGRRGGGRPTGVLPMTREPARNGAYPDRYPDRGVELTLVDDFTLVAAGRRLVVPHSVERILAYLALAGRPVNRATLAGALWLDASQSRAANSLRTGLWRLRRVGAAVNETGDGRVSLAVGVRVDVADLSETAQRLRRAPPGDPLAGLARLVEKRELLPDWDDDWVLPERERFRLLRLGALERAAELLLGRSEPEAALDAALAACGSEPLRESARRLVVRAHLAEGNVAEAVHAYAQYRALLRDELGVQPSRAMETLIGPLGVAVPA